MWEQQRMGGGWRGGQQRAAARARFGGAPRRSHPLGCFSTSPLRKLSLGRLLSLK